MTKKSETPKPIANLIGRAKHVNSGLNDVKLAAFIAEAEALYEAEAEAEPAPPPAVVEPEGGSAVRHPATARVKG